MWCAAYYTDIEKDVCNKVAVQNGNFHLDIESQALRKEEYVHEREPDEALGATTTQN